MIFNKATNCIGTEIRHEQTKVCMIELLNDFPPHVAAYRAYGIVQKEEYEKIVTTKVDEVASKYGKINFLVLLQTDMWNYSFAAFINYIKVSFEHFSKWNRMAVVTDQRWLSKAYEMLSHLVPGEIRSYEIKQFDEARHWVSQPLKVDIATGKL
jgi:hypothetical protein